MQADLNTIYESTFGRIVDFRCKNREAGDSRPEYVDSFSINFTRRGSFGYRAGRERVDVHSGVIFFERAGTERVVNHGHGAIKDECTSLELTEEFTRELEEDWARINQSTPRGSTSNYSSGGSVIRSTPVLEYLHASVFQAAKANTCASGLKTDVLLVALLQEIGKTLGNCAAVSHFDAKLKDRHLETIDRARSFIIDNFQKELSLSEIARHARVSIFHFSRLFKHFTARSPYQYLIDVRLRHAALLLRHTSLSVTRICYESGFNSFEHFIAAFKQNYSTSPRKFRQQA
jgi:AraC family transcriptional regulator